MGDRKGRHAGDVGGDANSAFNKVSRGCHLNIVAYSLFSSSPCEKEIQGVGWGGGGGVGKGMRKRTGENERRGKRSGNRVRWQREKRKIRRGKLTEKIRGQGGEGGLRRGGERGGRNGDHRDVLSVCIYMHTHVRVYTCRRTPVRALSSEKRTANRTFFASCMIQPQYLISSAAFSPLNYIS